MSVDTAKVEGRRSLHFNTLDDVEMAEVDRIEDARIDGNSFGGHSCTWYSLVTPAK